MAKVKFVQLPDKGTKPGQVGAEFWVAVDAKPGQWAEWPSSPRSVHYAAGAHSKNGRQYEARVYQGTGYIRAVEA